MKTENTNLFTNCSQSLNNMQTSRILCLFVMVWLKSTESNLMLGLSPLRSLGLRIKFKLYIIIVLSLLPEQHVISDKCGDNPNAKNCRTLHAKGSIPVEAYNFVSK